jgi:hypothetical protein
MSGAPAAAAGALALLLALPATAQSRHEKPDRAFSRGSDVVLLRRDCRTVQHREEVTLFGSGTVRLRRGEPGAETMVLGEIPPDAVAALVGELRGEPMEEAGAGSAGPEGEGVESCLVELPVLGPGEVTSGPGVAGGPVTAVRFRYRHFDSLSLPLARVVARVDELVARVSEGAAAGRLPPGYRPRPGDVLRRSDGVLFTVVRATAELPGLPPGWELQGTVQPLVVYIQEPDVPREFVELVSRQGDPR